MAFKKKLDIGTTIMVKFEEIGQQLQGYYIGTFEITIKQRLVDKHVFQNEQGLISVLGQTHLTSLLQGIPVGTMVRATLVGSKKTQQPQPMKLFEVEYDETDRIDVGQVENTANAAAAEEPQDGGYAEQGQDAAADMPAEEAAPVVTQAQPLRRPVAPVSQAAPKQAALPKSPNVSTEQRARANQLLGSRPKA